MQGLICVLRITTQRVTQCNTQMFTVVNGVNICKHWFV